MTDAPAANRPRKLPRDGFVELVVLLAAALAAALVFSGRDLDVAALRPFYGGDLADPWPRASEPLWRWLYASTPWITGSFAAFGGALLAAGMLRRNRRLRLHGMFIVLSILLGPGLLVNAVLKDHWGRARPREIVEFGGRMTYTPPLLPSDAGGKSFPCGHCSVGFLYAAGWWLWRRTHPRWARVSLAGGLLSGFLLGLARMAAGGHFLSDVVWAGLIAFGAAHVVYYHILRIPHREDWLDPNAPVIPARKWERHVGTAGAVLAAAGLGTAVMLSWCYADLTRVIEIPAGNRPVDLEITADRLDIEIHVMGAPAERIECTGDIHGFGWPTDAIRAAWTSADQRSSAVRYKVTERGRYVYLDALARISVPAEMMRKITVHTGRGNVSVIDDTRGTGATASHIQFDLDSARGRVDGLLNR
jgi:lipid A 4'-phosphatase